MSTSGACALRSNIALLKPVPGYGILTHLHPNCSAWHQASVPSTILAALVEAKAYPDPYYGVNLKSTPGDKAGRWLVMPKDRLLKTPGENSALNEKADWFYREPLQKHVEDGLYVSIVPVLAHGRKHTHSTAESGNVIHAGV